MSCRYGEDYFEKTSEGVGMILKGRRPLSGRWTRILRRYRRSGRLLDIGCGQGFFLKSAEKYYLTYGMDVSAYCANESRIRADKSSVFVGDATHLGCRDEIFDLIACFDLLEHIERPGSTLGESHRALVRGGILMVRVPNTSSIGARLKGDGWFGQKDETHVSLLSNEEWIDLIKSNGFEVLDLFYDGLWDTPYFRKIPKILQDLIIKIPSLSLFWLGLKFDQRWGENLCIIARKM